MCVCVCVCVCEERRGEGVREGSELHLDSKK